MAELLNLIAKITLDKSEYDRGLDDSEKSASTFGEKLKSALGTAGKVGGIALGAVTAAGSAVVGTFVNGTKSVAEYGDNIDKMSQKLGISREAYQEWNAVLQHSGTSIDSMSRGMQTLQRNAVNSADKFEKLGISQDQLASMSTEDLFSATITGLQNMGEGAERTALASELLGGSAKELGALLNTSAEDTQAMRDRVHELGGVMSDDAVKAAAAYQDSLQDMQTAMQGLGRNITSDFLPSVTKVMDGITSLFTGDASGAELITEGISDMIDKIMDAIPKMIDTGTEIMESLLDVIIDNLPEVIEAGTEILMKLIIGIINALPKLIEKAPEIVKALVSAIIKNAPELLRASLELILTIGKGIVNNLPKIAEKGREIIENVVNGIAEKLPDLLKKGQEAVAKIVEGIGQKIEDLKAKGKEAVAKVGEGIKGAIENAKQWGRDLMGNFISGITSKLGELGNAVGKVASKVKGVIGFSEPEEGPLSDFHTYAPDMMKLFAQGIRDNTHLITEQLAKSFDFGDNLIGTVSESTEGLRAETGRGMTSININVYGAEGQDVEELAQIVSDKINRRIVNGRRVWEGAPT